MKNSKIFTLKKLKKQAKGITLIALVVTIIVLLILAGIALNLTIGQNGIFSRAQTAANTWRNAERNEQLAMGEADGLLEKYLPKEQILAKDVLVPNSNGDKAEEKSPYVKYGELIYRVLWNDEEHGLQIVADDNVCDVTLGDNDLEKTIISYNNAVDILNNKAKEYQGPKAIDARSLGSIAKLKDGKFQGDTSEMTNKYIVGSIKQQDTNSREDFNQIRALDLRPTGNTWLASRCIYKEDDRCYFGLYFNISVNNYNGTSSDADGQWEFNINSGEGKCEAESCGLRPVLLLPSDTYIIDGNGTKEQPYIIE